MQEMNKRKVIQIGIPVLLVVVLVGLFLSVVCVNFSSPVKDARQKATQASIHSISIALDMSAKDNDAYPDPQHGLTNLVDNPGIAGWSGPYLTCIPTDAWGNQIQYTLVKGKPHLRSAGPDMEIGTKDDFTN